jgi:hypothetical protein
MLVTRFLLSHKTNADGAVFHDDIIRQRFGSFDLCGGQVLRI